MRCTAGTRTALAAALRLSRLAVADETRPNTVFIGSGLARIDQTDTYSSPAAFGGFSTPVEAGWRHEGANTHHLQLQFFPSNLSSSSATGLVRSDFGAAIYA